MPITLARRGSRVKVVGAKVGPAGRERRFRLWRSITSFLRETDTIPAGLSLETILNRFVGGGLVVLASALSLVGSASGIELSGTVDALAARDVKARLGFETGMVRPMELARMQELRRRLAVMSAKAATEGLVRIVHMDGDVAIDPVANSLDVVVRQTVSFLEDGTNSFSLLSFLPFLAIEHPDGSPIEWTSGDFQGYYMAKVSPATIAAKGDRMDLVLRLSGVPDCSIQGAISVNLCAWGDVNYLAGDVFLPGGMARDFATADLRLTLPAGLSVAATGVTVSVSPVQDGKEIHRIVQDFPTDSRSFGIASYVQAIIPRGVDPIRTFTMGSDSRVQAGVPEVLGDMKSVLDYYSERIGAFLFPKMDACQVTNDAGAAFGWPALLWIPDGMFRHGGSQRTALFAHELGHQWFPDMIQNNDAFAAWLSEGFAEYLSTEYMGTVEGPDYPTAIYNYYGDLYRYFVSDVSDYGLSSVASASVSDSQVYQLVTYYKGAIVCHVIEKYVGTDVWNQALKAMHADLAGKEAYYDTDGLKAYLEAASGKDLTDLFTSWVQKKGYPIYTVDVTRQTKESGGLQATVRIRQTPSNKYNSFKMPVQLGLVTEKGEIVHEVMVDKADQSFAFDLDSRLARVRFDPARNLLKRVGPGLSGDMDLSGEVDGIDLVYVAWSLGGSLFGNAQNFQSSADFDANAIVDEVDLSYVTDAFGKTSNGGVP